METEQKKEKIKEEILGKLRRHFGRTLEEATEEQVYQACALSIRDRIVEEWMDANQKLVRDGKKRLYYLSAEFLMGRALGNNLINLGLMSEYRDALSDFGFSLEEIEGQERDAGLGNGGLGRLAACFLDSLATLDLPVTGCGIRYEHGLFRQCIVDGKQVEMDDDWLESGNVWEIPRPEDEEEIRFGGKIEEVWTENGLKIQYKDSSSVFAVPYDYPVIGYKSEMPATLRLWSARAKTGIDMGCFNRGDYAQAMRERELAEVISKVLYPGDNHEQGKQLRLKQFYFFASASMQHMVHKHKKHYGDLHTLPAHFTVQINDTHPALAIPELMRILMDEEAMGWDEAMDICQKIFHYTNHTVLAEGLESWNAELLRSLLPRIYQIIEVINEKFCGGLWERYPGEWEKISDMAIVSYGQIRMANLCAAICGKVNGVSALHGRILKERLFRNFYVAFPDKFLGITNGVTHRRWLAKANEPLTRLLCDYIGGGFLKDYTQMQRIADFAETQAFLDDFAQVKLQNKQRLCAHLQHTQGVEIDPYSLFDVQAKRLHEYKRQLLKVLHILHLYNAKKADPSLPMHPVTFLFAAKASPGYTRAKEIISLILSVAQMVNGDPDTRDVMKVVFIENYSVSEAEILIPAADLSEQISTAGLEASGTGNMKFMMNGAVTLGTMDGANIEILEAVGKDNIFIFGATDREIARMEQLCSYRPEDYYQQNANIRMALERLIDGSLPIAPGGSFSGIYHSLLFGDMDRADRYYLLYDFASYDQAYENVCAAYADA